MPETAESRHSLGLASLRRKTVVGVLRTWRELSGSARHAISGKVKPSLPKEDIPHLREQMQSCLNPKGGEITARAHTVELGRTYLGLNEAGKHRFLALLADEFDTDRKAVASAIEAYRKAAEKGAAAKQEADLREALTTPRSRILRQFTALPNGFKFLVDMRADVVQFMAKDAALKGLDYDLKQILASWFDIGLLDLVEITWNSPAALLEKLIAYEAVHQIRSWDDLKNRLDADRRVYAFFHNKMPLEPLIFVQVALVKGMSDSVQKLLDTGAPVLDSEEADTAIFYSISNAQKGLAGISFGNFLIKRVVAELSAQFPQIKTFATLSPVPGFRRWLDPLLSKGEGLLTGAEEKTVLQLAKQKADAPKALLGLLNGDWYREKPTADALKPILMRLGAHYLLEEKKGGKPLDPVSNFHLFNGARLERINWLADTSGNGMKQAAGLMVNYYYKLPEIDENHEAFVTEGKIVASRQVKGYV